MFLTAVLTPFDADGRVDLPRLRAHVLWLVAEGVNGFVATAATGEFPYLSQREREAVHRTVIDAARGRPVYPMTWDPSPATTRYLSEAAAEQGAAGVLLPPPLLYPLDDGAVRAWFAEQASAGLPLLGYHDPHQLRATIGPELYAGLRRDGILAGLMDASGDAWRIRRMADADPGAVWAGGDRIGPKLLQHTRLAGVVSTLANVWPSFCLRLVTQGELQLEEALLERVQRVERAGGLRALKALLRMGCRAPLVEPEDDALLGLPPAEVPAP